MIPSKIASHPDEAAELLTERYKGKKVTEGLVRAWAKPHDALEKAIWDTVEGRVLGAIGCTGIWLDRIGAIVDEPRNARADLAYKAAISVRIRVNRSKGRAIDVIEVARLLDVAATYLEYYPLAWEVEMYNTTLAGDFIRLLTETKAASSYGVLVTSTSPEAQVSMFTDASGPTLLTSVFDSAI